MHKKEYKGFAENQKLSQTLMPLEIILILFLQMILILIRLHFLMKTETLLWLILGWNVQIM